MSVKETADRLVEATRDFVARQLAPRDRRIEALEARLASLEGAKTKTLADAYQGAWLSHRTYLRGALVQHGGCAWLALDDTAAKPGEGSGWKLLISRGRDAR